MRFVSGVVLGAAVIMMLGAQPANRAAEDVTARLERLESALLAPKSTLPTDPEKSIEGMLSEILASTRRTEAMLANLDEARLEDLAARVRFIHDSLITVKVGQISDLERRMRDVERQFQGFAPGARLDDVVRRVDQIERDVEVGVQRAADENRRQVDSVRNELRRLDRRMSRVESKIR